MRAQQWPQSWIHTIKLGSGPGTSNESNSGWARSAVTGLSLVTVFQPCVLPRCDFTMGTNHYVFTMGTDSEPESRPTRHCPVRTVTIEFHCLTSTASKSSSRPSDTDTQSPPAIILVPALQREVASPTPLVAAAPTTSFTAAQYHDVALSA